MRHNNNSRRTRGRNSGGNRRQNNNPKMQTFDSNGPDVRIRGNAFQITEKYMTLARDAASAGDAILAESYYQHAEHYQRMINEFSSAADRTDEKIETAEVDGNTENVERENETPAPKKRSPRAKKPQTVDA